MARDLGLRLRQPGALAVRDRGGEPADPDPPAQPPEIPRDALGGDALPGRGAPEKPAAGEGRAVAAARGPDAGDPARGRGDGQAVPRKPGGGGPAGAADASGDRPRRVDEHGVRRRGSAPVRAGQDARRATRARCPPGGCAERRPDGGTAAGGGGRRVAVGQRVGGDQGDRRHPPPRRRDRPGRQLRGGRPRPRRLADPAQGGHLHHRPPGRELAAPRRGVGGRPAQAGGREARSAAGRLGRDRPGQGRRREPRRGRLPARCPAGHRRAARRPRCWPRSRTSGRKPAYDVKARLSIDGQVGPDQSIPEIGAGGGGDVRLPARVRDGGGPPGRGPDRRRRPAGGQQAEPGRPGPRRPERPARRREPQARAVRERDRLPRAGPEPRREVGRPALGGPPGPVVATIRTEVVSEAQLSARDLSAFDAVVLCNVAEFAAAEVAALDAFLKQGGGVVVFGGDAVVAENYNRLLYRDGDGILPAVDRGHRRRRRGQAGGVRVRRQGLQAPDRQPVPGGAGQRHRRLDGAKTWQYQKLKLPDRRQVARRRSPSPSTPATRRSSRFPGTAGG